MEANGPQAASAHLDFTIQVPGFVFLQAGTGGSAFVNQTAARVVYGSPVPSDGAKGWAQASGNSGTITVSAGIPDAANGTSKTYLVSMP